MSKRITRAKAAELEEPIGELVDNATGLQEHIETMADEDADTSDRREAREQFWELWATFQSNLRAVAEALGVKLDAEPIVSKTRGQS